jgi:ANTAR domain-containing protein
MQLPFEGVAGTPPSDEPPRPKRAGGRRSLPPEDVDNIVARRAIVEQAKGILMFVYDTDANTAFEMLRRRSRITHVKLLLLAAQLINDVVALSAEERLDMQSACDHLLLTLHERVNPESPN